MKRYDERNPTNIDEIVKITGLDPERTIKSLNRSKKLKQNLGKYESRSI
jgi:hypothetical protein